MSIPDPLGTRQSGLTLIELVMFIVIISVALAGIVGVFNLNTQHSADPMVQKQALAIAESVLEEVELMPFTFCDPDDAQAATATGAFVGLTGCATTMEALGPEAGETRYAAATPFDNVNDYNGFTMNAGNGGIRDITNAPVGGVGTLDAFSVSVAVTPTALGAVAAADSLRITVTVTGPGSTNVVLDGYRTRYAPNATP
jgi:MSHA pilin protein MshD